MENFDPMGVHTGESIVVAPSQTLSDRDHQMLRNAALKIVRAIGIVGGCNVQFSLNQQTGDFAVIEINPRLSRSSALASKATGYPIARVAAKIALGSSLPELKNAITGTTAAFEPALDYCVLKIPKWPFEKFVNAERTIGTQMKSTGEAMAIGRTFEEALMKAIRSLEVKLPKDIDLSKHLMPPTDLRLFAIFEWFRKGKSIDELNSITKINPWFLERIKYIVDMEERLRIAESKPLSHSQGARKPLSLNIGGSAPAGFVFSSPTGFPPKAATSEAQGFSPGSVSRELLLESKQSGFSDLQISKLIGSSEPEIRVRRKSLGILPTYKIVDSCAGEFEAITPYYYSTYEDENEARQMDGRKIVVIGSGPIRIGQGIEFDYCCSHAAFALKEMGFRSIMVNNNPETVSTDFDTSDRLYFEPLTFEDVLNIVENEGAEGVILQFGGQTSINLAEKLHNAGIRIFGTQLEGIDVAEDREKFRQLANELGISQPANGTATSAEGALSVAARIGYPVVVRPSYVIAGRGMRIVYTEDGMRSFIDEAVDVSENKPVLIDKYLENAFECEVDAVCDGKNVFIGGIMEHIEFAGVHSGDANIVLPSQNLDAKTISALEDYTRKLALALGTIGLINIQFAVKDEIIYILEANPRASRTVPFLSKAIGIPLAKLATRVLLGEKLNPEALEKQKEKRVHNSFSVKGVVFPFLKIKGADIALGPEMKSTGETMGISESFDEAYVKALLSSGLSLPEKRESSAVLLSLRKEDKQYAPMLGRLLKNAGFMIFATPGTAAYLQDAVVVDKISANPDSKNEFNTNSGTTVLDVIDGGKISLVINTPQRGGAFNTDGFKIRRASIEKGIPCITNVRTAIALLQAVEKIKENEIEVKRLDEYGQRADSAGAEDAG